MISLIMQGGSPCENAPSLRVGTNNVEIAALMAPKPMLMVAATGDWTRNTPREEYPAMKKIYDLYDAGSQVETVQIDAPHNYNKASREQVYQFFGKHVLGETDLSKLREKRIRQEKLQDMLVFHGRPLPPNALDLKGLFAQWIKAANAQNAAERDVKVLRERLAVALGVQWPQRVEAAPGAFAKGKGGAVLAIGAAGPGDGRSQLRIDLRPDSPAAALETRYYLTFNRSDDARRVQDIINAVAWLRQQGDTTITIKAAGKAAVLATFAAAVLEQPVKLDAPLGAFRGTDEEMIANCFVPGLQKAGGIQAALRLLQ